MKTADYYVILECKRSDDHETLKQSFRRLARRYHPDQNQGNLEAEERFKLVVQAWEVLGDPGKRRHYDLFGHLGPKFGPMGNYRTNVNDIEILKEIAREQARKIRDRFRRAKGRDVRVTMTLTFAEALKGVDRVVELPRSDGGERTVMKKVEIPIPPSTADGKVLRWKNQGAPGVAGGESGDLYVVVRLKPHELFFFEKDRLCVRVPVSNDESARPTHVQVPTPWGLRELAVPESLPDGFEVEMPALGGLLPSGLRAPLFARFLVAHPNSTIWESYQRHVDAYKARRG